MSRKPSMLAMILAALLCLTNLSPALALAAEAPEESITAEAPEESVAAEAPEESATAESGNTSVSDKESMNEEEIESLLEGEPAESTAFGEIENVESGEAGAVASNEAGTATPSTTKNTLPIEGTVPVRTDGQSVTPGEPDGQSPDDLFAAYVDNVFSSPKSTMKLMGRKSTGSKLTGVDAAIYTNIADLLPSIAAGERASTVFEITVEDLGLEQTSWTAEELGVPALIAEDESGNAYIPDDAIAAVSAKTDYDLSAILHSLLADFPYQLYWYEKTRSTPGTGFGLSVSYDYKVSAYKIGITGSITISFPVAEEYKAGTYTVDTAIGKSVQTSVANAQSIVSKYSGNSDFEKLTGYKDEICSLVAYNYEAAGGGVSYGNPWQMIWVFDGNPYTNVVCEGYAKAFKYLCDESSFSGDISCITVSGMMSGGTGEGPHMWNIVHMEDGNNYFVDVTNCDEGTIGAPDLLFITGAVKTSDIQYQCVCHNEIIVYLYDTGTISLYDAEELEIYDPAHVHNLVKTESNPATCTEAGNITYWTCSKCGKVYLDAEGAEETRLEETVVPAAGHSWSTEYTVDKAATCAEEGSESIHCAVCGEIREGSARTIGKLAHTYGEWSVTKEPTQTETGLKERACKVCGSKEQEEIPALETKTIEKLTITGIQDKTYTGKPVTQDLSVEDDGVALTEGADYTVAYEDNTSAGTATVTITGIGSYTGTVRRVFMILPGKTTRGDMFNLANNVKVTWKEVPGAMYYKVYREGVTDKKETRKDPVIVTTGLVGWDKESGLTNGHAYRYRIVASLTGKGDSSGDSPLSYSKLMYRLKTVVIRSVKNTAPGKVTVKYDKTTSGDSYVLQYCEREDMVGAKTKVVLGASNTSYVIGGLKKGKTYYISIRVRKKVDGIDYYTTFGVAKKVTIVK